MLPPGWAKPVNNYVAQGNDVATPIAENGQYYAFLSKEDLFPDDAGNLTYDILFELVPKVWWNRAVGLFPQFFLNLSLPLPRSPATFFQIPAASPQDVLRTLGLDSQDDVAEGAVFEIQLQRNERSAIRGRLYESVPPNSLLGRFFLSPGTLLAVPKMAEGVAGGFVVSAPTPRAGKRRFNSEVLGPAPEAKRIRAILPSAPGVPHVPPPLPVTSIGVMDIGQGSCNMLLSGDLGGNQCEPVAYYDVGFPAPFFQNSAPEGVRANGPILQNTAGTLEVILSHWDADHWGLASGTALVDLPWTIPKQSKGFAASNFSLTLRNPSVYNPLVPFLVMPNYTLFKCVPPAGARKGAFMNNSGIAMMVTILLPEDDGNPHAVVMTGDASFGSLQAVRDSFINVTGVTAIHHGSEHHGAPFDLPPQADRFANSGRVAYSYGIKRKADGNLAHCYKFPRAAAMVEYRRQGWGTAPQLAVSTAEDQDINADPPAIAQRGNVRMGAQTPPVNPAGRLFSVFRNRLN